MRSIGSRVLSLLVCSACLVPLLLGADVEPAHALPNTSSPTLNLVRTIRTSPFVNTTDSVRDGEGATFVPNVASHPNLGGTDSLWLADDNGNTIWEINPYTGQLKGRIGPADWGATGQYSASTGTGTGALAVNANYTDLESLAYDRATDTLYAFSGTCCASTVRPTAFRLKRATGGAFRPESWQPLAGHDFTGSAWNPADGKVYVGKGSALRTYDYVSNAASSTFSIAGISGILGLSFSDDGADLFVVTNNVRLFRVTWATRSIMSGWSFDLTQFNVLDSRAVDLINDQFYVFDGYDGRSSGDPLRRAVFVFGVCCDTQPRPTASFTWSQAASPPRTIQFTDTSTGNPTSWQWDFGDNTTSTARNPTKQYTADGNYTVTLRATNGGGTSAPVSQVVNVSGGATQAPTASFTWAQAANPPLTVQFTDTSSGTVTSWSWDFGDGTTSTMRHPTKTYQTARSYTVTLTAYNGTVASTPASQEVTVTAAGAQPVFTPSADAHTVKSSPTTNYGSAKGMRIKLTGSNEMRTHVKFVVSGTAGKTITSAKLRLYVTDPGPSGGTAWAISSDWVETGPGAIAWGNQPSLPSSSLSTAGAAVSGSFVEFDVTSAVTGDNTYSFAVTSQSNDVVVFRSRETTNAPQLVLTYG